MRLTSPNEQSLLPQQRAGRIGHRQKKRALLFSKALQKDHSHDQNTIFWRRMRVRYFLPLLLYFVSL
jgi:hypothetical protein